MTNCSQLLSSHTNTVDLHDTVSHVLEISQNLSMEYYPVLNGLEYLGMISLEDLEDADAASEIISLQQYFIKPFVRPSDHFLQAVRVRSKFFVDQVPVINEKNEWEGCIESSKLLDQLSQMTGAGDTGSLVVLEIARHDYAPGEINRLVESNDAMIMQMNTIQDHQRGVMQVVLRISREEVSDIVATFQRHEYSVLFYYGDETFDNSLQQNLSHLLNYLNI